MENFLFEREEIELAAQRLGLDRPKNLGDVIYTFRFRRDLPKAIQEKAPAQKDWVIRLAGDARYRFSATELARIEPSKGRSVTEVPDATPGIIEIHALSDEQALLAKLRYNRLIDIFLSITCYSLQSHLRTKIPDLGQTETDEIYVGVDKAGTQYVIPVQAKAGRDKLGIVQIEQDMLMCKNKFPSLVCRPVAAQFMQKDVIALFEFTEKANEITIFEEKHYQLLPPENFESETPISRP